MLANNNQRLTIWQNLEDKFSYEEMVKACTAANVHVMPPIEFAHKVGMILVAEKLYPDQGIIEAYKKLAEDATKPQIFTPNVIEKDNELQREIERMHFEALSKPCCGGGQVR